MIAVLQKAQTPGISVLGMTLVSQFVVSYGYILPVNSSQGMVGYGTGTLVARDFIRSGIAITVPAYLLTLVFAVIHWRCFGRVWAQARRSKAPVVNLLDFAPAAYG